MYMSTTTTRVPIVGDIWLVHYPYTTPGNYDKIRPGIVVGYGKDDEVIIQKLTTKDKRGNKPFSHPKLKQKSFLSKEKVCIRDYNLIRYIGKCDTGV